CCVDDLCRRSHVWCNEGRHARHREWDAEPEEPWPALAPSAVRLLKDDSPHRRIQGIDTAREEQTGPRRRRREPIDVRIELEQIKRDDAEDELPRDLAGHVAQTGRKGSILH